jgi:hypothetical protein
LPKGVHLEPRAEIRGPKRYVNRVALAVVVVPPGGVKLWLVV